MSRSGLSVTADNSCLVFFLKADRHLEIAFFVWLESD